jgi:histidinol phosphatase-like PHP family hydrolase
MQLFDVHVHTAEVSHCGRLSASETVEIYVSAGYDGICVTDHYNRGYFESLEGSWSERIDRYYSGYEIARARGEKLGLTVLHGAEIRIDGAGNEYLVYGVSKEDMISHPHLYALTIEELSDFVHSHGGMIFEAHPFRPDLFLADTRFLDGIEVFNGNPRHNSSNYRAIGAAAENGMLMLSGSDSHEHGDCGLGGMVFRTPVKTEADLLSAFRSGNYAFLVTPQKLVK